MPNAPSPSPWMHERIPSDGPLTASTTADVCIVGAGMVGLSVAHELARRGRSVLVLDDGPVGSGETSRTTAHLVTALDTRYFKIAALQGEHASELAASAHGSAIERIERIIVEELIACDFARVDGYLFAPPERASAAADLIERELIAATRAGIPAERLPSAPIHRFDTGPCLRFPEQAQFDPMRYAAGLVGALKRHAGRIHTDTHATKIHGGRDTCVLTSEGHRVSAGAIVVATNTPVNDLVAVHTKQVAHRSYALAFEISPGSIPPALFWDGYWDDSTPFHYVRLAGAGDGLIVGGEDHKVGQADDNDARYSRLEAWTRERFPQAGRTTHRWSGQIMEPHDGLAFIGRNPMDAGNVYIATGDAGNGMTHAAIAATIIPDLMDERENRWAKLYDPSRISFRAAAAFARETANYVVQYKDWVTPAEVRSVDQIQPGRGAIVRRGIAPIAVYRDDQGTLHECSAICPHLGCVVHWNPGERSWDCPCHGSRFDRHGRVINGPANKDLAPAEPPETARAADAARAAEGLSY